MSDPHYQGSADPVATAIQLAQVSQSVTSMGREIGDLKTALAAHVADTKAAVAAQSAQTSEALEEIKTDLKALVGLRNKGAGALWLAGIVTAAGFLAIIREIIQWIKG